MSERPTYKCYLRYRRWIDRAFVHELRPARWRELAAHLRTCTACCARYDRLGRVSRALSPGSPLPVDARERIGRRVAARVAADVVPAPRSRSWAWLGAAGAAAASAAVLLLLLRPSAPLPDREGRPGGALSPRGRTSTSLQAPGARQPGVRFFCIDARGAHARVAAEARATQPALAAEPLRCDIHGELQLAYSTPDGTELWMVAYGRDDTGMIHWYAPRFADQPAVALRAGSIDEILPWTTRLDVKHNPGDHTLHVLFFARPVVAGEAVQGMIEPHHELHGRMELADVGMEAE